MTMPHITDLLTQEFNAAFGGPPRLLVRAPGRVNIIGEHTDYNDGFVLPAAIEQAVWIASAPRDDREVHLVAANLDQQTTFPLENLAPSADILWSNYQRGVAAALQRRGYQLPGLNAVLWGNVPLASGLSSSAAVEVAMGYTFQQWGSFALSGEELALACQEAEHTFVGVKCGIMDQFISVLARPGHALLIDCRSLEHRPVPLPGGVSLVICDTRASRTLASSAYNQRRAECETGAQILGVKSLRDITPTALEEQISRLPPPVRQRVRHVVSENQRVLDCVSALKAGNLAQVGQLLLQSHASLRNDYQVSSRELDAMVAAAMEVRGTYGARMTGAGFGGCVVALVESPQVESFIEHVGPAYMRATQLTPAIYASQAAGGVSASQLNA